VRNIGRDESFTSWFEEIYELKFEQLYRYAFSITKDKQMAEDVVSEVFTNIWSKKPHYEEIKELNAYLHVSVKHLAIRMKSKDPHNFSHSNYDEMLQISDAINPENLLLGNELKEILDKSIEGLTFHAQLVYDMSRNKGYSNKKISEELGISTRTVEKHIQNVLKKIKLNLLDHFKDSNTKHFYISKIINIGFLLISVWYMLANRPSFF